MRSHFLLALCLGTALPALAQAGVSQQPGLPKDPRAILEAAAPYYDFNASALKPWHLKATYQLYDDKGNPAEQGTYEYWWVSAKNYRSTWSRAGATHTDWYTADGNHAYLSTGEGLTFFEYKLQSAFVSPLPDPTELSPLKIRLQREDVKLSGEIKLPCIEVIPLMPQHGQIQVVPLGLFPTYCFDTALPALRMSYSFGTVAMEFNHIVTVQKRLLAQRLRSTKASGRFSLPRSSRLTESRRPTEL